ncbi:MAG: 3-oxoacyl-ACP reductase [Bacilli bacterium]|nr:3-oxoacyl-ACP reductase [Bacilli bacterium]
MLLKLSKKVQMRNFKLADAPPLGTMTQHPNKVPFTCSLFAVDVPSDGSPEGAGGKLIRISSTVCDQYLNTFEGMGMNIDYEDEMSDHDTRFKVGVITKTFRSLDGMAMAEGYIYGKDFPDVVATVRYYNGLALEYEWPEYQFGTSIEMEAKVTTAPDDANILDVIEFCGTGAAILFAEAAAYKSTSFAARNKKTKEVVDMTPEQIKAMEDAMKALKDGMTTLSASVQTVATEVGTIKTDLASVKAGNAGAGTKTPDQIATEQLKAAQDKATALEKEVADLKAAATPPAEPQRKTATPAQLLAKHGKGGNVGEDDAKDYQTFCATVDRLNLPTQQSMALKLEAKAKFQTNKDGE